MVQVGAVRVLQLRWVRDATPEEGAGASEAELQAVTRLDRRGRRTRTVREFVDAVAKLGGYQGRRSDGQSLWWGYQRLADIVLGLELGQRPASHNHTPPHDVGNR